MSKKTLAGEKYRNCVLSSIISYRYSCLTEEVKQLNTSDDVVSGAQEDVQIVEQRERAAIPSPRSQQN